MKRSSCPSKPAPGLIPGGARGGERAKTRNGRDMKQLPNINRRPSGLSRTIEAAISRASAGLKADAIAAVIRADGAPGISTEDTASVFTVLDKHKLFDIEHVYWVVANRERQAAARALIQQEVIERADFGPEAGQDPIAEACARLRTRYVYAAFRDEVWDRRACSWISMRAMDALETHAMPLDDNDRPIQPSRLFARDGRATRVHNERYIPGCHDEIVERDGVEWLNTWTGSDIQPVKGDAKPMLDHILYLCNEDRGHAGHLLDWLAYGYQHPGAKINHAPLIISEHQGVGKDTLGYCMARLIGRQNVKFVEDSEIAEGRNSFALRKQLVIAPEIMTGDRRDIANKLKPLITQPTLTVNEKNVRPYDIENTVNFLMFSNHTNAAHIEDHDRRYFVVICKAKPQDAQYYRDLYAYLNSDAIAGFAWVLANRDLIRFDPAEPAPMTADKEVVRKATMSGVEAWLEDAWVSRRAPFRREIINLSDARKVAMQDEGAPAMTVQQIAAFLRKKKGADLDARHVGGTKIRLWAIADGEEWQNADITDIRKAYDPLCDTKGTVVQLR